MMTKVYLKEMLNAHGYPSLYAWAKQNRFDTVYVQNVVTRWLKPSSNRIPLGTAFVILQKLSNTIGVPLNPNIKVKKKISTAG